MKNFASSTRTLFILLLITVTFILLPLVTSAMLQARVIDVPANGDLQEAINSAVNGDTLQTADGATYICNCVVDKGITIQGKSTIKTPNSGPAIYIPPRTPPVVIKVAAINTTVGVPQVFDIVRFGSQGEEQNTLEEVPQGLTIDGVDIHGQPGQDVQRGVTTNGANFKLLNSRIREIHGKGYEANGVGGWNGPGPFTILDSRIEAAGENAIWGGAQPSIPGLVPADLVIRRSVFYKPPAWRGVWTVKNILELKTIRRAVIDGNIFDGNWLDAQQGYSILFTVRPNDSGPAAVIEDVQFTNNIVRNVAAGLHTLGQDNLFHAPSCPRSADPSNLSLPHTCDWDKQRRLHRVTVANNLWEIDGPAWGGDGCFAKMVSGTDNVTIANNTVRQTGNIMKSGGDPHNGFIYTNNVHRHNDYGIHGDDAGFGNSAIARYYPGGRFERNAFAKEVFTEGSPNLEGVYPANNLFPAKLSDVLDSSNRVIVDYQGTDGKRIGADLDAIARAVNPSPSPTPSPTATPPASPTPTPSSTPSPTPTATPSPTPTPDPTPFPCTMDVPASISVNPYGRGQIGVSLNSMVPQIARFIVTAVSNNEGQISVFPASEDALGTSAVISFGVTVKKRNGIITFESSCGIKKTVVMVQ